MAELNVDPFRAARLLLTLRRAGITDPGVLAVMEQVPRDDFVGEELADMAFEDCVLPIACGQIIPRPSAIGAMLQWLQLGRKADKCVLIVGLGSGYTASLLAVLAQDVFAVERYRTLHDQAADALARRGITNVQTRHGDGLEGWNAHRPYDRILVMGALAEVPEALVQQLSPDGFLIAPVGMGDSQQIMRYDSDGDAGRALGPSVFTALTAGYAKAL